MIIACVKFDLKKKTKQDLNSGLDHRLSENSNITGVPRLCNAQRPVGTALPHPPTTILSIL